jgi:hypothetical protein
VDSLSECPLIWIIFGDAFNQPMDGLSKSKTLCYVTFGHDFEQPLTPFSICTTIKCIVLPMVSSAKMNTKTLNANILYTSKNPYSSQLW